MSRPLNDSERDRVARSLQRYRNLVAALEGLLEQGWPTDAQLDADPDAVWLDDWMPSQRKFPILEGFPRDHPSLGNVWTHTSLAIAASTDHKLVRTESRWYRLGESLKARTHIDGAQVVLEDEDGRTRPLSDGPIIPTSERR